MKTLASELNSAAIPPEREAEVLARMVEVGGERAVAECRDRLADCAGRVETYARLHGDARDGAAGNWGLNTALPKIREEIRLSRVYRARLAAMLGESAPGTGPTEREELHATMLAAGGQKYVAEVRGKVAALAVTLRARLTEVEARLEGLDDQYRRGFDFRSGTNHAHDVVFDRYADLVEQRRDLSGRLASLDHDHAKAREVQAGSVTQAILAAGGREAVAKAIADSWLLAGSYWSSSPDNAALEAARKVVEGIDGELALLGGPGITGPVVEALQAHRQTTAGEIAARQKAVDGQIRTRIADLIAAACDGGETARASIEQAARSEPRAFPAGFVDAIGEAQFERSRSGSLVQSMIEAERPAAS